MAITNLDSKEMWSDQLLKQYKAQMATRIVDLDWKKRSKGEKLLRAAAKGVPQEEIDKIDRGEDEPLYGVTMNMDGATLQELYNAIKTETRRNSHLVDATTYTFSGHIDRLGSE